MEIKAGVFELTEITPDDNLSEAGDWEEKVATSKQQFEYTSIDDSLQTEEGFE